MRKKLNRRPLSPLRARRRTLVLIGAGLAASGSLAGSERAAAQELDPGLEREIETRARATLDSARLPGLAVGIVAGDRLAYAAGFGVADRETARPVTTGTLFQIGSSTKPFTATLMAILAERGLLALDDPVARYLPPDVRPPTTSDGSGLTLRHLATHTGGLPRQPPTLRRKHADYPVLAFSHFELLRSLEQTRLEFRPGERFQYSSFGFALLGHLLERASGLPYETLLTRELLEPLGMASTTVTLWPELRERLATPYYPDEKTGVLEEYTPWDPEALSPASGIASTVEDLGRFLALHLSAYGTSPIDRTPISAGALRSLHEPEWRISEGTAYGLGWVVTEVEGVGRVLGHGGEVDGYTSQILFAPEAGHGVILLANAGDAPLAELGSWILRRVSGPAAR